MPQLSYRQPGLILEKGAKGQPVRDLQRDLRSIGYLRSGIDGSFGTQMVLAVKALQHDLLTNEGKSTGGDGNAPVRVVEYNKARVSEVTGQITQELVGCISDILDDPDFPKLPRVDNPVHENQKIAAEIEAMSTTEVPVPFLVAILRQESGLMHFREPAGNDEDTFIVVGMDRNGTGAAKQYAITSRGYGAGQYTLFHHPPTAVEVQQVMLDPARNVLKAIAELKNKLDHFVIAQRSRADDRVAEFGLRPLRHCKYPDGDPRYMKDCKACALASGTVAIDPGLTPLYTGTADVYRVTKYYDPAPFKTVPARAHLGCDWPYAVRRYNGSGVNSFWYQGMVLNHLVRS